MNIDLGQLDKVSNQLRSAGMLAFPVSMLSVHIWQNGILSLFVIPCVYVSKMTKACLLAPAGANPVEHEQMVVHFQP
jgi:hypothetical protein